MKIGVVLPMAEDPKTGSAVMAVYSIRGEILALVCLDCQRITADGVNGQHRLDDGPLAVVKRALLMRQM